MSLLSNNERDYDSLMCESSSAQTEIETRKWIATCLTNGYILKKIVDGTIGFAHADSDLTVNSGCQFEVPHWLYYERDDSVADRALMIGQESSVIGLDQKSQFSRH